jgi:hypothetical protein
VALVDIGRRLSDTVFPAGGTVAQAALLLCARMAGYVGRGRERFERLPSATAAERLTEAARRLDAALPERARVAELLVDEPVAERTDDEDREPEESSETTYPFLPDAWLRTALRNLVADFGAGMAEKQAGDPDRLLADTLTMLSAMGLIARVDGGVLVLPLLARYRSVTAHVKTRPLRQ